MIKDENNCRMVSLGNGTVFFETDTTGKILIIGEKEKNSIGKPYTEGDGDDCTKADYKTVCLYFDGENAINSINMLVEYLENITENLLSDCENIETTMPGCEYCEGKICHEIDARNCEGWLEDAMAFCEERPNCYYKQRQHLKAENKELSEKYRDYKKSSSDLANNLVLEVGKSNQYIQALKKIEEYASTTLGMPLERRVILSIINEVKDAWV